MTRDAPLPRLVVAGAGGPIGSRLLEATEGRYERVVLTRGGTRPEGVATLAWNPRAAAEGDEECIETVTLALDGAAGLVNLAGSSIAAGRLGRAHVERLRSSRADAGATLALALTRCRRPPAALFQASGTGIYGDRGEHEIDESTPPDPDARLGEVGVVWESAAKSVEGVTRVVIGRMGLALAPEAEAWQRLLLPIRLFVGGPLGSGRQWWPWVLLDDAVRAILWALERDEAVGVYNVVGEPVRQIELTRRAARRLRRPALLPVPAFALRLLLGGVADELLLSSQRVVPARLLEEGFEFEALRFEEAVARLLA